MTLKELKAGDLVLRRFANGRITKETVSKVTPTGRIVITKQYVDGMPHHINFKAAGRNAAAGPWEMDYIEPFDQVTWNRYLVEQKYIKMRLYLRDVIWNTVPDENIETIYNLLTQIKEVKDKS